MRDAAAGARRPRDLPAGALPGRTPPRTRRRRGAPSFTLELIEEGGSRRGASFAGGEIARLGTRRYRSGTWDRLGVPLPGPFPLGYHTLRIVAHRDGRDLLAGEVPLIACPERCWPPPEGDAAARAAGLGVALYGLRSNRNAGVGDFADLPRVTRWAVRELGVFFVGLNPLHATRNRYPHNHSPYLPLSALFHNHLYLALEEVPEFAASAEARGLLAHGGGLQARLRAAEHVPWDTADRFKLRVWQTALDHYRLFGIDDLEQARTYGTPQFAEQFGRFTTLTSRYGGPALLKADLEAIKRHLYVPMAA